jgi:hypothetical protein
VLEAIIRGPWKLIKRSGSSEDGDEGRYLYNMANDPGELRNEAKQQPELFRRLYGLLHEVPRADFSETPFREVTLDEQQLEELRVLGYVESEPSAPERAAP